QDVENLECVLSDPAIGGFQVKRLVDVPKAVIEPEIEEFFSHRKRDDLMLLYFSGHGIKDEDGRLYFATPNTRTAYLRTTAVSAALVEDILRRSLSRRQILLLDCCYSGAFARGM